MTENYAKLQGSNDRPLLSLENVEVSFGTYPILWDVSFDLREGEILGLVGESGSGKSMTALAIMGLLPRRIHQTGGRITFDEQDLSQLDPVERRRLLGQDIAMIFQDPMTALNPLYSIEHQLVEALRVHRPEISKRQAARLAAARLAEVDIPDPRSALKKYPHQFSGGQRQRICIAMALMAQPKLLIADEATTALDVTVQYRILELLQALSEKYKMSLIVISHNLALIHHLCQRVLVLYTGQIVEEGKVSDVLHAPFHPYTYELLRAIPENASKGETIPTIPGHVPSLFEGKALCPFYPRCRYREARCLEPPLEFEALRSEHFVRCKRSAELFMAEGSGSGLREEASR